MPGFAASAADWRRSLREQPSAPYENERQLMSSSHASWQACRVVPAGSAESSVPSVSATPVTSEP